MEKARHPHVVRTWTVERTRQRYQPPQQPLRKTQFDQRKKAAQPPTPAPKAPPDQA